MALFWAIAAALLLLALWMVAGTLWRSRAPAPEMRSARQSNLALLKAQLAQADQDLAAGHIDAAQHRATRTEIERRVLEEEDVAAAPVRQGSPRGTLMLFRAAQARALFEGRDHVVPEDVKRQTVPVLAHRLGLETKARYTGVSKEDLVREILDASPVPA